jgi:transposase
MVTDSGLVASVGRVGSWRGYVCPVREQVLLLPVSMRDWLEEDHLAWWVLDAVELMDTGALHTRPGGAAGRRPYLPEMLLALVLYGYMTGTRSSRRLEQACRTDAAFRVICGGLEPDHATIARFVVEHERALGGLFAEGLRLCAQAGLVELSTVALDGTKMGADASLERNRDAGWIRREVAKLMALTAAEAAPAPPLRRGGEAPAGAPAAARGRAGRLARLQAALAVLEAAEQAQREQARARAQELAQDAERGRAPHGRPPHDRALALARAEAAHQAALARERSEPTAAARRRVRKAAAALAAAEQRAHEHEPEPEPERQANVTDPDSRIMPVRGGGWIQGYNAQAAATPGGIVLATMVSHSAADTTLYEPMTDKLAAALKAAGIAGAAELVLADAGYWSHDNHAASGPDRLIATTSGHNQRQAAREHGPAAGPPPEGATPEEAMQHRLRTPEGAAAYKQRSGTIEPVFGQRKHNTGMRGFRRRGLQPADSEWAFMGLVHNLGKLYRHHRRAAAAAVAAV